MRHRQHPHTEHFTWIDNRCRFCKKFIKSKGGYAKYCNKHYNKLRHLLSREYQIWKELLTIISFILIKDLIIEIIPKKHLHWNRFIKNVIKECN